MQKEDNIKTYVRMKPNDSKDKTCSKLGENGIYVF